MEGNIIIFWVKHRLFQCQIWKTKKRDLGNKLKLLYKKQNKRFILRTGVDSKQTASLLLRLFSNFAFEPYQKKSPN